MRPLLLARTRGLDSDVAFLAGLLHDIGRARCWKLLAQRRGSVDATEAAAAVAELHTAAGAELAAAWHLPDEVIEACRFHHAPDGRPFPLLVMAADALSRLVEGREDLERASALLVEAGVQAEDIAELVAQANKEVAAPEPE